MRKFLCVLVAMAFILLATSPLVLAERSVTADMERSVEQYQLRKNKQNLTGWNGILFFCHLDDDSNQAAKDICEKTYVNAEFLGAAAKINLIKGRDGFHVGFEAGVGELLVVEVKLVLTERVPAVHANVRAYAGYYNAVETRPWNEEKNNPRMTPRSGDLIFWERTVLGASSGTVQDLVTPLSQGIEQRLKEFFADYLKAQR